MRVEPHQQQRQQPLGGDQQQLVLAGERQQALAQREELGGEGRHHRLPRGRGREDGLQAVAAEGAVHEGMRQDQRGVAPVAPVAEKRDQGQKINGAQTRFSLRCLAGCEKWGWWLCFGLNFEIIRDCISWGKQLLILSHSVSLVRTLFFAPPNSIHTE
jgi:hypothetical protein